jgi:hypothetical protein
MTGRFYQLRTRPFLARGAGARLGGPLLAAVLSFVAWQPFVRPDFDVWRADDGEYHLLRVYVFERAFLDGQLLPRWTPDLFVGFGYPIFNFYAPGTYYAALVLRALGLDVYTTVQALGAIATCVGAAGAYCLAHSLAAGRTPRTRLVAGLTAALAYAYAPYPFITNLIIRADLAETLGLALLPWVALGAWCAARAPGVRSALVAAGAVAAVILTHNLTALVALPVAVAFGAFAALTATPSIRMRGLAHVAVSLALALGATTFFWLPALLEQRHVQIEVALASGHKSPATWLIDPLGATAQTGDPRNPQTAAGPLDLHPAYPYDLNYPPKPALGQGALALSALALVTTAVARRRCGWEVAAFVAAGTGLLWLLTTTWSRAAWDAIPLMRFLQFSWRLYGPLALALGLTAGIAGALFPRVGLILLGITVLLGLNTTTARPLWIDPAVERRVGGPQLVGTENTLFGAGTTTGGEFVPRSVNLQGDADRRYGNGLYERLYPEFGWLAGRVRSLDGQIRIDALAASTTWTDVRLTADGPGTLAFRTVAFPGWRLYLDGADTPLTTAPLDPALGIAPGFVAVAVPAGEHHVQLAFSPTRTRSAAGAVSLVALTGAALWAAGGHPRRRWLMLAPVALLTLACAHDAIRPQLRPPARPAPSDGRLALDLLKAVGGGKAALSSPSGAQLGAFMDVRRLRIGDRDRAWLYMHAPASASFEILLPERAAFQAGLGIDPGAWNAATGDGVRFVAEVALLDGTQPGAPFRVLDEPLNPRASGDDRRWHDRWVDLSAFGGRRVRLTLRTEPGATSDFDWSGWADPAIVLQRDARRPGGGLPVPVPTPRSS